MVLKIIKILHHSLHVYTPDSEIVLKRDFGIVVNLYKKNYTRGVEMLQFHPSLRLTLSNLFFFRAKTLHHTFQPFIERRNYKFILNP